MVCFDGHTHTKKTLKNSKKKKAGQDFYVTRAAGTATCLNEQPHTNRQLRNTSHQSADHSWDCMFTQDNDCRSLKPSPSSQQVS